MHDVSAQLFFDILFAMKISVITAVWNAAKTIRDAMESVARQRGVEVEYIVVDGGSTDGTVEVIKDFETLHSSPSPSPSTFTFRWISEKDNGLYDAINKGIRMATGDVVGICNADDVLASDDVLARIAQQFEQGIDAVYADVRFVAGGSGVDELRAAKTTRYCTGKFFRKWMFRFATFPAHPSTFVRKTCFEKAGYYSLDYKICADFEMMLRLFWKHNIRAQYLPICTHVMRRGGLSTGGISSNIQINREDLRALRANGYWSCLPLIYTKYLFKIWGFLRKCPGGYRQ